MTFSFLFFLLLIHFPLILPYSYAGRFLSSLPKVTSKPPELILITGCTGAGKSTFGMTVAINRSIIRCVSSDTIRQILRMYSQDDAILRPSYGGIGDPIAQWKECCAALKNGLNNVIDDAIARGYSLVLEGVHLIPSNDILRKWRDAGGAAVGVVLTLPNEEEHRQVLINRGKTMLNKGNQQLNSFERIRSIQSEMIRLGREHDWEIIERTLTLDPLDLIAHRLGT